MPDNTRLRGIAPPTVVLRRSALSALPVDAPAPVAMPSFADGIAASTVARLEATVADLRAELDRMTARAGRAERALERAAVGAARPAARRPAAPKPVAPVRPDRLDVAGPPKPTTKPQCATCGGVLTFTSRPEKPGLAMRAIFGACPCGWSYPNALSRALFAADELAALGVPVRGDK